MKNNKAITLVALVITIIILLILAGITISQLTGSGIFEKAQLSKEKSEESKNKEEETLAEYTSIIENSTRDSGKIPEGYIKPEGTMQITENGEYDVTEYANVDVAIENNTQYVGTYTSGAIANNSTGTITMSNLAAGNYIMVGHRTGAGGNSSEGFFAYIKDNLLSSIVDASTNKAIDGTYKKISNDVYKLTLNTKTSVKVTYGTARKHK